VATISAVTNAVRGAVTATVPTSRPTIGKSALLGVIFLTAVFSTCALLGPCLPFPEVSTVREKIEHLARHGDDYEILFVGSSHVQFQIMPTIFDRVAGMNGVAVKSFNAGIPAMVSPEDSYVLEEMLRRPHGRLRWVFVELSCLGTQVWGENTSRFAYWHDTARLTLLAQRLRREARGKRSRLAKDPTATIFDRWSVWTTTVGRLYGHARAWLIRGANLSRGSEVLSRGLQLPGWEEDLRGSLGENGDGWVWAGRRLQQMTPEMRKQYDGEYAERLANPAVKDRADAVCQSALERIVTAITRAGARPVFLVPPTTAGRNFYPTEERERELTILDFSDVRQNAKLFLPENRMDLGHVNTAGAEIFTEDLARRFVELAKGSTPAP